MKVFFGIIFGFLVLIGVSMYIVAFNDWDDSIAIKNFMNSRAKSPVPRTWVGQVGKGI